MHRVVYQTVLTAHNYEILVMMNDPRVKPMFVPLCKFHGNTGEGYSNASCTIKQSECKIFVSAAPAQPGLYRVNMEFVPSDVGAIMMLSVIVQAGVQQIIQLTDTPVVQVNPQNTSSVQQRVLSEINGDTDVH